MLTRVAGAFTVTNSTLLDALNTQNDNGKLEELKGSFGKMLGPRADGSFRVFSFRETLPLKIGPFLSMVSLLPRYTDNLILTGKRSSHWHPLILTHHGLPF
jgi:hypothetical protein